MPPASAAAASPGPSPVELRRRQAALWRLLAVGDRDDDTFRGLLDDVDDALSGALDPYWSAWRSAVAARRSLADGEPDAGELFPPGHCLARDGRLEE